MRRLFLLFMAAFVISALLSVVIKMVQAKHIPLYTPILWKNKHIIRMWATSFPADTPSEPRRARIYEVQAHDNSCYAGTCNMSGSWAHWYINDSHPHFDLQDSSTRPNYSFFEKHKVCGNEDNRVSIHWEILPIDPDKKLHTLGSSRLCPKEDVEVSCETARNPFRKLLGSVFAQVKFEPCPPGTAMTIRYSVAIKAGAMAFQSQLRPGDRWFYGSAYQIPPTSNDYDFMSVVAHEMGHIYNLDDYPTNTQGYSTDEACVKPQATDGGEYNSTRHTMCTPLFPKTKRQLTPELDSKETVDTLY